MCVLQLGRMKTDWVSEGRDVIKVGKCYRLRGVFTLISHTHTNIKFILNTPMKKALAYTHNRTLGLQDGKDYQRNLLWYAKCNLTDKKQKAML